MCDRHPALQGGRHEFARHVAVAQQHVQGIRGCQRIDAHGEAVQIQEELAVRVVRPHLVCEVDGQRGLADAAHAADRGDRQRGRRLGPAVRQQVAHLAGAAVEVPRVVEQVAQGGLLDHGPDRRRHCLGRAGEPDLTVDENDDVPRALQQIGVQFAELRTRVDAELFGEHRPDVVEDRERVGLPAGPVERGDQVVAQRLAQRVLGDQFTQIADHGAGLAGQQPKRHQVLERADPLLLETGRGGVEERAGHAEQGTTLPQQLGNAEFADGVDDAAQRFRILVIADMRAEPVHIDECPRGFEHVAAVGRRNRQLNTIGQHAAQAGDRIVNLLSRRPRWFRPKFVDEPVGGDGCC
jgi:hypothetical protein